MINYFFIRIYDILLIFFSILKYSSLRFHYIKQLFLYVILKKDHIDLYKKKLYLNNKSLNSIIFIPKYFYEISSLLHKVKIDKKSVCLDIGANIGIYGFVLKLLSGTKLYSFEPLASSYKILKKNSLQFEHWTIYDYGIGERKQKSKIFFIEGKEAQASMYFENASHDLLTKKKHQFNNVKIDRIPKKLLNQNYDLIKIDVEGMESSVIKGLEGVKWRYLLIEYSPLRKNESSKADLLELINNNLGSYEIIYSEKNLNQIEEILIKKI